MELTTSIKLMYCDAIIGLASNDRFGFDRMVIIKIMFPYICGSNLRQYYRSINVWLRLCRFL